MTSLLTSGLSKSQIEKTLSYIPWKYAEVDFSTIVHTISPLQERVKSYLMDYNFSVYIVHLM